MTDEELEKYKFERAVLNVNAGNAYCSSRIDIGAIYL